MQDKGSKRGSGACLSDVGCAGQTEERGQETGGATDPGIREPAHSHCKDEKMRVAHLLDEHG